MSRNIPDNCRQSDWDEAPEGPACDECGAEMVGTFDHDDSGPSVEWHCPEEHACIVCGEKAHGAECDSCGEFACSEHVRGGETAECDHCHAAREAEAFATLGGIEHRVWQAAQAKPCGCYQADCPSCSADARRVA